MSKIDGKAWKTLLTSNEVLARYGNNAIGLLALSLRFDIDDIALAGVESFVDGSNDKKNDFVYVDEERGIAVVIQAYYTKSPKQIAPSNKASDLSTALTWLLAAPEVDLPIGIRSHALKIRNGLKAGRLNKLYVWYVHNCTESTNVGKELGRVQQVLDSLINTHYRSSSINSVVLEVGGSTLTQWYLQSFSPIYVDEPFEITCSEGFDIRSEKWEAFVTSISARELYFIYKNHKSDLFSANVRDYLGDREADTNINFGIKESVRKQPQDFWVFNNGLTILTNDFRYSNSERKLFLQGISVVNGAQTTGAIGTLRNPPRDDSRILVRFIKVHNTSRSLIGNIVKFNNSQNKVTAADFRSNDEIQKRLVSEVDAIDKSIVYQGGRRGGDDAAIKRKKNVMPSFTVAQALASFHGDPVSAYNKKSFLWNDDAAYSKIFNEKTTGAHIIFVYSLFKRLESIKFDLLNMAGQEGVKAADQKKIDFFRKSGSIFVYIYAISRCIEIFTNKPINDAFTLGFGGGGFEFAMKNWEPIVNQTISFVPTLEVGMKGGMNQREIDRGVDSFKQLIESYFSNVAHSENRFTRAVRFK